MTYVAGKLPHRVNLAIQLAPNGDGTNKERLTLIMPWNRLSPSFADISIYLVLLFAK